MEAIGNLGSIVIIIFFGYIGYGYGSWGGVIVGALIGGILGNVFKNLTPILVPFLGLAFFIYIIIKLWN